MTSPKAPKKSETIEVRVPYGAKTAFATRCRENGVTVSEAVRAFMEREIGGAPRARPRLWYAAAALAAGPSARWPRPRWPRRRATGRSRTVHAPPLIGWTPTATAS